MDSECSKLQALVYDILPSLEEVPERRCSEVCECRCGIKPRAEADDQPVGRFGLAVRR